MSSQTAALLSSFEVRRLIEKKRDGHPLSAQEWAAVVRTVTARQVDEGQLGALMMACVLRGMDDEETVGLTRAMIQSGDVVSFTRFHDAVDKHSTGGVGDAASLIVVPLVAACGVRVAKLSGRALGHTGGTIDKLESIPGFHTALDPQAFEQIVFEVGCAIAAQSETIVPADKIFYALRDRTATIPSVGLVTASIVSKKIAGGAKDFAFDVKVGSGAFMKTLDEARTLAASLVRVSAKFHRKAIALITDMREPLSPLVGNALEVIAARDFLLGSRRPTRLTELVIALGTALLELRMDRAQAKIALTRALGDGTALAKFEQMIAAQGGDIAAFRALEPASPGALIRARDAGYVEGIDAAAVGNVARQAIERGNARSGVEMLVQIGDAVKPGDPLARICGESAAPEELENAFTLSVNPPPVRPVVYETLAGDSSMLSMR